MSATIVLTLFVRSVRTMLVYDTCASCGVPCPGGQEKLPGPGGLAVSDAVTFPFLSEANVPVAVTGPERVVSLLALGLAPPRLTQT